MSWGPGDVGLGGQPVAWRTLPLTSVAFSTAAPVFPNNPVALEIRGDAAGMKELLSAIGYRADLPLPVLLSAFQRRWRPERVDGAADAATLARLAAVAALHGETLGSIDARGAARA